jgi:hypothetical protein
MSLACLISQFCLFSFWFLCGILLFLSRLLVWFSSGVSSPKWVKPAAEGGGLLVVFCFQSYLITVCDLRFCYLFAITLST